MTQTPRDDELITKHIQGGCEYPAMADARLKQSGVHIWALAGYGPLVDWDVERIASDYALTVEEVEAALAYYRRHRAIIEGRIAANSISAA